MKDAILHNKEKSIDLLSNEICVCGSGFKFRECCKGKGYKYNTLGKNFKEEDIIFNSSNVNEIYDNISKILINEIVDKDFRVSQGKEQLKKLYEICTKGTEEFTKYISCKKGCSNCCNIYLDCTAVEAELISSFVKENFSKEKIEFLECKIKSFVENVPSYKEVLENEEVAAYNYMKFKQPCMFLNEDKSCSIYDVRPFNCRKLISFSHPQCCEKNESISIPNISVNYITSYAINHLSMNITRFKRLKIYSKKMKEERAVYKSLYHWFKNGFEEINREL